MVTSGFKITDTGPTDSPISLFSLKMGKLEILILGSRRKEFS